MCRYVEIEKREREIERFAEKNKKEVGVRAKGNEFILSAHLALACIIL